MRISLIVVCAALLFACSSTKTITNNTGMTDGWFVHLDTAKSEAVRTKKPIFLLFTGSDWCAPCMQLEREVLSQKAFKSFAEDNLILVKMDFIRKGPQPSIEMQVHRDTVATNYLGERQSVPTVFLLKEDGSMIAKTTFRKGGADAYVRHIRQLLGNE
jgi:thiol-disulfide isomerase/thioredoxin